MTLESTSIIASIILVAITATLSGIMVAANWKIYAKAGRPGWWSIVPIYGTLVLADIIQKPRMWSLWLIVPSTLLVPINYTVDTEFPKWVLIFMSIAVVIYLVAWIIVAFRTAKRFGKTKGFAVGLILLPLIFFPILAFGKAVYRPL